MPSEEDIKKIIAMHEDGKSQRDIAKEFDKSVGWVNGIFKKLNIQSERSNTKNATQATITYSRERRLALNNLWFEKIEKFLVEAKDSKTLRELAIPYGVAEDKRHLLEPPQVDTAKSGLEEIREALRPKNDLEATSPGE